MVVFKWITGTLKVTILLCNCLDDRQHLQTLSAFTLPTPHICINATIAPCCIILLYKVKWPNLWLHLQVVISQLFSSCHSWLSSSKSPVSQMTYALIVRGLSDSYFLQLEKKDTRPSMQFFLSFLLYLLVNIFLSFSDTGDYLTTEKKTYYASKLGSNDQELLCF